MMITFKVEGLADLERRLREFGPSVAKNGLRSANYAGAIVMREAAKQTAPVRTGLLKSSITAFKRRGPDTRVQHSVGVKGVRLKYANTAENRRKRRVGKKYQADGPAFYGRFIEFGYHSRSGRFIPARPFMRPAFEKSVPAAVEAIKARLAKAVELAARK